MKTVCLLLFTVALLGCASHHPKMDRPQVLGPKFWMCDDQGRNCYLAQNYNPPQLTPVGCALHKIVTLGRTAQECKKVKK